MKKETILLLFILGINLAFSQQHEFFKAVKDTYDKYENDFIQEFEHHYRFLSEEQKILVKKQYTTALSLIDSARNMAYLEALVKTKIALNLEKIKKDKEVNNIVKKIYKNNFLDKEAKYPTGINGLRYEVIDNFYTDAIQSDVNLTTNITFIVEKDGSISDVKAVGDHIGFNRQAEIAVYLLSNKFEPARSGNEPIRSTFQLPLKMRFE